MTIYLKQSTASQEVALGFFVDKTDGDTEETGLTIAAADIRLHKAGGTTLTTPAAGATHISNGIYYWVADATDTNTPGSMAIYCHPAGALATKVECVVLAANVYDSLIGGGDILDVSMTQILGTPAATPATAGILDVNVKNMNNVAATAITTIKAVQGLAVDGVITTLTNLPAITANWLTAAGIAAGALDGKGNWNIDKTGYTLTAVTGLGAQTANITGNLIGTVSTVTAVTGLTAATVHADLDDIQARLPAALTAGGNMKSDALAINAVATTAVTTVKAVQGLAVDGVITTLTNLPAITSGWLTATGIAADAITAAKVHDDVSTEFRTKALALTTASGVVGSGSTTANVVASSVAVGATTSLSTDAFKGRIIIFNSDTTTAALRGQAAAIVSHTSGSTPTFTLAAGAWTTEPLTTDAFTVV